MRLERLITTRGLVLQSPSAEEIRERSKKRASEPIRLFYGETFDDKGHPIDSVKYYLFVGLLAESLREEGLDTQPSILVADTAACRNVGEEHKNYYMLLGDERARFVDRVNQVYNTGLKVTKMSEYIDSPEFIEERQKIIDLCKRNPKLMKAIEKTVPESKIDIERDKGFMYSFDEIATIIDLDVKVGPPREDLYDEVARVVAQQRGQKGPSSLFLTPTFPLGMNWAYFFSNEGIEDHGITAYKAGSKRLQRNRIILERSQPDYINDLITNSFISTNPALPNPVLDIGIICEMAKRRLEESNRPITLADDFYRGDISESRLKERVTKDVYTYVLSKFE